MRRIAHWLRQRLMAPLLQTDAPAGQLAWGTGVGLFIALLPIVGQLYLLPTVWAAARYLLRRAFHLPIAYAMVLLINPPLKILTFYVYLVTGDLLLRDLLPRDSGYGGTAGGFAEFRAVLMGEGGSWLTHSAQAVDVALRRFGLPIVAGGVLWACVGGAAAFVVAWGAIVRYRRRVPHPGNASPTAAPQVSVAVKAD